MKIVLLVVGALALSLFSHVLIGTNLIIEDKTSYIYDYHHHHLRTEATNIELKINELGTMAATLGHLIRIKEDFGDGAGAALPVEEPAEKLFRKHVTGVDSLSVQYLEPPNEKRPYPRVVAQFGKSGLDSETAVAQFSQWGGYATEPSVKVVGTRVSDRLPVVGMTEDFAGRPLAYLIAFKPDSLLQPLLERETYFELSDALGHPVSSSSSLVAKIDEQELSKRRRELFQSPFSSGAREWELGGKPMLVAYQRISGNRLLLLSIVPKELAFSAARSLVERSAFLGFSILLVALGLALFLVKSIVGRLRDLWGATQRVGQGDFSVRVPLASGHKGDELTGLANSFNAMADQVAKLMVATAEKARMEKELETAQTVQNRFFPNANYVSTGLSVAGGRLSASECAGDWWNYALLGRHLIVVVGDVMGHGVSSALVTAAAYSAFSNFVEEWDSEATVTVPLASLVTQLNRSVFAAGKGQVTMTATIAAIDLKTKLMSSVNLGHPTPFFGTAGDVKSLVSLPQATGPLLGLGREVEVRISHQQLAPGQMVLWYTDGVFAARAKDGEKMSRRLFLQKWAELSSEGALDSERVCNGMMKEISSFFGDSARDRPDDITVVIATVPRGAS